MTDVAGTTGRAQSPPRLDGFLRRLATFGGAGAMLIAGTLTYVAVQRAAADREWVLHTHAVIEQANATLSAMQDAETGQRGYLLTGDSAYLAPFSAAVRSIDPDTAGLRSLTRDNPLQQDRLDALGVLIDAKLDELRRTIALRSTGGFAAAAASVRTDRGKSLMDSVRTVIAAVTDEERRLLNERRRDAERSARFALIVLIVGTFAAIMCALALNGVLNRYVEEQATATKLLAEQNDRLREQAIELEIQAEHMQDQATELETANETLSEQMALVESANSAKSDFLAAVSHELRTPLNAIDGYSELLLLGVRGPMNSQQTEDVGRIRKSSRHLLSLINQVLNLAKVESGQMDLDVAEISVAGLLEDAKVLIEPQMAHKGVQMQIAAAGPGMVVYADADRARQILLNLLSNAQKFTDAGGVVRVESGSERGKAKIRVSDTGRGIPAAKLEEIFEPFAQLNRLQTPDQHRGIGLGLSISRTLARAMGGDITVESEPGIGSAFTLTLPTSPTDR